MSRMTDYRSRPSSRPDSANLIDLHVYKVPLDIWRDRFNNLLNQSVCETVSLGIIRVPPDLMLCDVRTELNRQLDDLVPAEFVFLRSVGRSLTKLKAKQEYEIKAKYFLPPTAYAPELYLLEAGADVGSSLASDSSSRAQSRNHSTERDGRPGYNSYRAGPYDSRFTQTKKPVESHTKGRYNDVHSSPNTNHTNEDSGIAGLSPEDRERDRYMEDHERRKRELQERLDREKARHMQKAMDEEKRLREEEERERERMDENERDRLERRRKAEAARRQREEEERRRQEEEQRKWDEEQDQLDKQRRTDLDQERDRRRKEREDRRKKEEEEEEERRKREREQEEAEEEEARRKREAERAKEKRGRNNLTYRRKSGENDDNDTRKRNQSRRGANDDDRDDGRNPETGRRSGDGSHDDDKNNRNRGRYGRQDDDRLKNGDEGRNNDNDRLRNGDPGRTGWSDDDDERKARRRSRGDEDYSHGNRRSGDDRDKDGRLQGKDGDNDRYRGRDGEEEGAGNRRRGSKGGSEDGFASPPALEMKSPREVRDTDSAYARRRDEKEKLLAELDEAREGRRSAEQDREELVKRAKQLQHKTTNRRNNARDMWKKRYFEEKKRTAPLEDQTNRLRHELEAIHRKLMSTLEGPKDGRQIKYVDGKPSPKNNYIIQCTRLQHEIEDLRRRAENAKMKLTAEMKLRNQADAELRALRADLTQKKINLTLSRNQQLAALNPGVDGNESLAEVTVEN